jgi:integrin alpha FG-GAP repeat containing protein 1
MYTDAAPISIPPSAVSQPIPLDYNGNMRLDMIGNVPSQQSIPSSQDGALVIWKNVWDSTGDQILFDTIPFAAPNMTSAPKCTLPNPHSSAIVDFNGDCLADLFLTCKDPSSDKTTYQIWLNDPEGGGYTLARQGAMPQGSGLVSFADMGRFEASLLSISDGLFQIEMALST